MQPIDFKATFKFKVNAQRNSNLDQSYLIEFEII